MSANAPLKRFPPRARGVHVDDGFLDVLHLGGGEAAKRIELRVEVFREVQEFVVLHFHFLPVNPPSFRFLFIPAPL